MHQATDGQTAHAPQVGKDGKAMTTFAGTRVRTVAEGISGGSHQHVLRVAEYAFPDCSALYVEVSEPGRSDDVRVIALSEAVHALMNMSEVELYEIGGRDP